MNSDLKNNTLPEKPDRRPVFSVIMNCLNGDPFLRQAIDSVYSQTFKDWEIIFWDNASTDRTAEIACSYGSQLRYFRSAESVSLGTARNLAVAKARGEFIAFLDSDDLWLPDKLKTQYQVFDRCPEIALIYGNLFYIDNKSASRRLAFTKEQPQGDVFRIFLKSYPINLQTVALRKVILDRLDEIFDPELHLSEEYDLFMRILHDYQAAYINEPLAMYRIHPGQTGTRFMEKYPEENLKVITKLHGMEKGFSDTYRSELEFLRAKIAYWEAKAAMQRNDPAGARRRLKAFKAVSPVFQALYYSTVLPSRLWLKLQDLRYRIRIS